MGLGSRKATKHDTVGVQKAAGVDPTVYWEHKPGDTVMTADGFLGVVQAVLDGPVSGNEVYEVTLEKGLGGGQYTASQLSSPPSTTAAVASGAHTADLDYPEFGTVLVDRPDIAIDKTAGYDYREEMADRYNPAFDYPNRAPFEMPEEDRDSEDEDEDGQSKTASAGSWFDNTYGSTGDSSPEPYDEEECSHCGGDHHTLDHEPEGPDRDDARVEIGTNRWGNETAYHAHHGTTNLGHFPDEARARAALWDHEDSGKTNWFPNHWVDGQLDKSNDRAEYSKDPHGWLMKNSPSYAADQTREVGHDVDEAMEGSEHLKGLLGDGKIGPTKYSMMENTQPRFRPGDKVVNHRGEPATIHSVEKVPAPGKSHRVQVVYDGDDEPDPRHFYEEVFSHAGDLDEARGPIEDAFSGTPSAAHDLLATNPTGPSKYSALRDQATCPHDGSWNLHGQCMQCGWSAATEDDEPCDNEWCQQHEAPHSKGEHIDPPHLDPNSDEYRAAEHGVNEAFGEDRHLGEQLLDQQPTGPTKYSSKTAAGVGDAWDEDGDDAICFCDAYPPDKRPGNCPIHSGRKTASVPNAERDKDDLLGHCLAGEHDQCEDYPDTNCLCECHDHHGVPDKYRTGWEDEQYHPRPFTSTEPHPGHLGSLDPYSLIREAAADSDFRFHFTASWSDVRRKAQRIRSEDGVRITAATKSGVVAEVKGDHHIYETGLQYVPGARKVATWQCGCKWAAYAWGRSPKYKRFEGRMCSHALAVQYEAQSRGMFGRDVKEDAHYLPGQKQRTPVVIEFDKGRDKNLTRRTVPPGNMRSVWSKVIEPAPVVTAVAHMVISNRDDADEVGLLLRTAGIEPSYAAIAKAAAVNDAWGDGAATASPWPTLPGATSPKDPQENPASAGFAASPDPTGWSTAPMSMGDRVASLYDDEAEDGDTDVCSNCNEPIKRTTIDPNVPWIHHHSGNSKCDVSSPADAVMLQGVDSGEAAPTVHAANLNDEDTAIWDSGTPGAVATLHDEPEPALPSTDGDSHLASAMDENGIPVDQSDMMTPTYDDALSPEIQSTGSVAEIVARFQATAGAKAIQSGPQQAGPSEGDIAAAAKAHLAKTALKAFSPEEQRQLINERGRAANLDRLDIADTHYAALDEIRGDDDDGILW